MIFVEVGLVVAEVCTEDTEVREEEPFVVGAWLEEAVVDVTIEDVVKEDVVIALVVIIDCVLLGLGEAKLLPEALTAARLAAEICV